MRHLQYRCPECAYIIKEIAENAPKNPDEKQIRGAEIYVLTDSDYITYTAPEIMTGYSDELKNWNKENLFRMADFNGKTVLDVGAGSGRLAVALPPPKKRHGYTQASLSERCANLCATK